MIVLFTGENNFLLQAELTKMVSAFIAMHGDMGVERIDGETASLERVEECFRSMPFLSERKMIVLYTPSSVKGFADNPQGLLGLLPDVIDLIMVEPKIDKRSSLYKFLRTTIELKDFSEKDERELTKWLSEYTKSFGGTIDENVARYMIDRIGANQRMLSNEVEKLFLYSSTITQKTVDILTDPAPQSTIFELLEAAFSGNIAKAIAIYQDQRQQKVDNAQIIAMLTWQLRILAIVKAASGRTSREIAQLAKLNPFVVRKAEAIASRLDFGRLQHFILDLLLLDVRSKRGHVDMDEAVQNFLIGLT